MRLLPVVALYFVVSVAEARIGETPIQFANRYGGPKDTPSTKATDKNSPLVEGAIHHTYEYQGWKIRAAFLRLDGPAVRIDFSKLPNGQSVQIQDNELEAIKTVNTPLAMTWKQILYNNPDSPNGGLSKLTEAALADMRGQKMWQRTDGAIICLRGPLIVRVELPVARQFEEKLKIRKNQKARASVPSF
jgi:hypothetical protein